MNFSSENTENDSDFELKSEPKSEISEEIIDRVISKLN